MNTRQLGNTDLHFSEVGFGAWAIGGGDWQFGWGPQDDQKAIDAMNRALELGVNWIDTAAIYGLGHSEELVAQVIKGHRDEILVATKCSIVWNEERVTSSSLKADSVQAECEASLRRLNTEYIDLYQIHWPNDEEHLEEGWDAIGRLIEQGKIRYGGVSNFKVKHLQQAQQMHPIASLQPPYSMLRRGVEIQGELDFCAQHNIGVIAYSPMQCGLLTGKFDLNRVAENDWRRGAKEFMEPNLSLDLDFVEQLQPIAADHGKTVSQLAIAWVLRLEVMTSAIVGARSPQQIEETVGGADWKIRAEDLERIDELLLERINKIKDQDGFLPD